MKRRFHFALIVLMLLAFASRQTLQAQSKVEKILEAWRDDDDLRRAAWGFKAVNLANGETVAAHDAHKSLTPASVMKIVTTSAVFLAKKSNDFLETELQYSGHIAADSVLHGDLILYGKGDPTLGSARFKAQQPENLFAGWKTALQDAGIKKITGDIIADDSFFSGEPFPDGWTWGDVGNYFGAGAYGLSFMDNEYKIVFEEGKKIGDKAKIAKTIPEIPNAVFINNITVAGANSGDQTMIYAAPGASEIHLEGTIPMSKKDFSIRGATPDPALLLARSFYDYLQKAGVEVGGTASKAARQTENPKKFYTHQAVSYEQLAYWINMRSVNFYAETLLRLLNDGGKNDWNESIDFLDSLLVSKEISTEGVRIKDGSGLSRENFVTCDFLCDLLKLIYNHASFSAFEKTLPVAGVSGTMANFGKNGALAGNLRAKSGSMNGVRAYAGFLKNKKGETICFSVIINNFECKQSVITKKIEALAEALVND